MKKEEGLKVEQINHKLSYEYINFMNIFNEQVLREGGYLPFCDPIATISPI